MQLDPMVTTGELERAFCAALVQEIETDAELAPLCPDEFIEEPLAADTVIVEEAVSSHKRHALLAFCALAGLGLGFFTALFF